MRTINTRRLLPEYAPRETGKPLLTESEILRHSEDMRKALYAAVDQLVEPTNLVLRSRMYMAVNAALPELPLGNAGIEAARVQLAAVLQDPALTKAEPIPGTWNPLGKALRKA